MPFLKLSDFSDYHFTYYGHEPSKNLHLPPNCYSLGNIYHIEFCQIRPIESQSRRLDADGKDTSLLIVDLILTKPIPHRDLHLGH